MRSGGNDDFDEKISTANVDDSATELLEDRCVVIRGKDISASIIKTITFTIILQLQNHGLKRGKTRHRDTNRPSAGIFSIIRSLVKLQCTRIRSNLLTVRNLRGQVHFQSVRNLPGQSSTNIKRINSVGRDTRYDAIASE